MKVDVAVLGFQFLIVLVVSAVVKQHWTNKNKRKLGAQDLCVKVQVTVLGSPSIIVLTISVDIKQH